MKTIYLSLIAANILDLKHEIKLYEPWCDGFHLDIMDNHLVPNLTFGADFINEIASVVTKPLSIHLMIDNPNDFLQLLKIRKHDIVAIQYKSINDVENIVDRIHALPALAGIAINPEISLDVLYPYLSSLDQVLLMSVKAGFSGQEFIEESKEKAQQLVEYKKKYKLKCNIAMDGGINETNIKSLADIGVESFIIGTGIFDTSDPLETLKKLKKMIE